MKLTIDIDDDLWMKAQTLMAPGTDDAPVINYALLTLVRIESAKRLMNLGGSATDMEDIPRRRND